MTGVAALILVLMKTPAGGYPLFQIDMAIQASYRIGFIILIVALDAIAISFQFGVETTERSR